MDKEHEKTEKLEADYTGYSEKQLDLAVDRQKSMTKQSQKVSAQKPIFQNKTKTIYTDKKK